MKAIGDAIIEESILLFVDIPSKPPASEPVYEDVYIKPIYLEPPTNTKYVTFQAVDILGDPVSGVNIEISAPRGKEKHTINGKGEIKLISQEQEEFRFVLNAIQV